MFEHHLPAELLNFLAVFLPDLLEDVPPEVRRGVWFQHNVTLTHFARYIRQFLNRRFEGSWIGSGGIPRFSYIIAYGRI